MASIQQSFNQLLMTGAAGAALYSQSPEAKARAVEKGGATALKLAEAGDFSESVTEKEFEAYRDSVIEAARLNPTEERLRAAGDIYEERQAEYDNAVAKQEENERTRKLREAEQKAFEAQQMEIEKQRAQKAALEERQRAIALAGRQNLPFDIPARKE